MPETPMSDDEFRQLVQRTLGEHDSRHAAHEARMAAHEAAMAKMDLMRATLDAIKELLRERRN